MTKTLPSLVVPEVIVMKTSGVTDDDKVDYENSWVLVTESMGIGG